MSTRRAPFCLRFGALFPAHWSISDLVILLEGKALRLPLCGRGPSLVFGHGCPFSPTHWSISDLAASYGCGLVLRPPRVSMGLSPGGLRCDNVAGDSPLRLRCPSWLSHTWFQLGHFFTLRTGFTLETQAPCQACRGGRPCGRDRAAMQMTLPLGAPCGVLVLGACYCRLPRKACRLGPTRGRYASGPLPLWAPGEVLRIPGVGSPSSRRARPTGDASWHAAAALVSQLGPGGLRRESV